MPFPFLLALGVGLQALGAAQQASAQKKQAQYQSQVEQNNAIIAEQNAMDSIRRGAVESAKHGVRIRQTYGSAKAAAAAAPPPGRPPFAPAPFMPRSRRGGRPAPG